MSLVHACLEPQPHHRPSAREFLQSLRQCPGYHNSPEELGHALSSIMGTYRASGHTGPSVAATPELEATLAALDVVRKLTEAEPPQGDTQRQPGPPAEQAAPRLPDTVKAAAVPIPVASHRPAAEHPPRGADARFSEPGALRPPAMASVSPPVEGQAPPIPPPRSRSRSPVLIVALAFIGLGAMAWGAVLLWGQLEGRDTQPVAQELPTSVGFQAPTSRAEPAALSADSDPPRASPMSPWEPQPEPEPEPQPEPQRAAEPEPEPEPPSVAPPEPATPEPAPTVAPDEQPGAKRKKRKKKQATPPPSHPVSVTVILHGSSQGAIRIDGDKIRGVRHGTRLEIPSGRHKFEWRMVGETTWRNAGRHRLTARSYWVRLSEDRGFALGRSGPEGRQ